MIDSDKKGSQGGHNILAVLTVTTLLALGGALLLYDRFGSNSTARFLRTAVDPWMPPDHGVTAGINTYTTSRAACSTRSADEFFAATGAYPAAFQLPAISSSSNSGTPSFTLTFPSVCPATHSCAFSSLASTNSDVNNSNSSSSSGGGGTGASQKPLDIVLLGDSQGKRYKDALVEAVSNLGYNCTVMAREEELRGKYFGIPGLLQGKTDCIGCHSSRTLCLSPQGANISIEYLRMEFVLDSELLMPARRAHHAGREPPCVINQTAPCKWEWSTQQVLFELYLKLNGRVPDHVHVVQNIHDCARRTARDFTRDLAWLVDIMRDNLGQGTHVYWWEATAPNPAAQPVEWRNVTSAECFMRMNAEVKRAIRPLVQQSLFGEQGAGDATWHATRGLFDASYALRHHSKDGVHFHAEWYQSVAEIMLSMC